MLMNLIHPESVVDVGCGDGTWLREFINGGVKKIQGLDGSYVSSSILKIDPKQFLSCDLRNPPKLTEEFDLALCVEVAEHLPVDNSDQLVDFLSGLSNIILFSAAIPFQTGVNHINNQWQGYWKDKFEKKGFMPITTLRAAIWNESSIPFFYKQNIILYVNELAIKHNPALLVEVNLSKKQPIDVVHPDFLLLIMKAINKTHKDQSFIESMRFHVNRRIRYWKTKMGIR